MSNVSLNTGPNCSICLTDSAYCYFPQLLDDILHRMQNSGCLLWDCQVLFDSTQGRAFPELEASKNNTNISETALVSPTGAPKTLFSDKLALNSGNCNLYFLISFTSTPSTLADYRAHLIT